MHRFPENIPQAHQLPAPANIARSILFVCDRTVRCCQGSPDAAYYTDNIACSQRVLQGSPTGSVLVYSIRLRVKLRRDKPRPLPQAGNIARKGRVLQGEQAREHTFVCDRAVHRSKARDFPQDCPHHVWYSALIFTYS